MIRRAGPGDPCLRPYTYVGDPEWLRREGLFVAEGRLVVERLLDDPRFTIVSVLVTPAALAALEPALSRATADVCVCDQRTLNGITGFNFHRGCLALARRPVDVRPEEFLDASRLLALEAVGNPDNVGGLFRTAAAFAAQGVLLDPASGDPLYRKAVRTSMAAVLRVPFARLEPWPDSLHLFRDHGFSIVALTLREEAIPIDTFAASRHAGDRLLVLVGAEGHGLSEAALAIADVRVRIPIAPDTDSLNVIVAAAIALERLR